MALAPAIALAPPGEVLAAAAVLVIALVGCSACYAVRWFVVQQADLARLVEPLFMETRGDEDNGDDNIANDAAGAGATASPPYLSLVVPAYNEADRLPTMLDEALGYLEARAGRQARGAGADGACAEGMPQGGDFTYEVVVVDDGSRDATAAVVEEYAARRGLGGALRCLRLARNGGKGCAVRRGMLAAAGALVLMVDADGATAIADVARLEAELYEGLRASSAGGGRARVRPREIGERFGIAVGSRAHLQSKAMVERSVHRNLLMQAFHALVEICSRTTVKDTQCGFKLFTRRAAQALAANQRLTRWGFDVEVLYVAAKLRATIVETPVRWVEMPGSKLNVMGMFNTGLEVLSIPVGYGSGVWQIRVPPATMR